MLFLKICVSKNYVYIIMICFSDLLYFQQERCFEHQQWSGWVWSHQLENHTLSFSSLGASLSVYLQRDPYHRKSKDLISLLLVIVVNFNFTLMRNILMKFNILNYILNIKRGSLVPRRNFAEWVLEEPIRVLLVSKWNF